MWTFVKSSPDQTTWLNGHDQEVCFIGRSNVGKSSLINALTNSKKLAITSNTPGRTQLINFFQEDDQKFIVDLPGYGYAKMSHRHKAKIEEMLQDYFEHRDELVIAFLLFDIQVGLTNQDLGMIEYLRNLGHNFMLVGTKYDRVNQSELAKTKKALLNITGDYILVSSKSGYNIDKLREIMNKSFEPQHPQGI